MQLHNFIGSIADLTELDILLCQQIRQDELIDVSDFAKKDAKGAFVPLRDFKLYVGGIGVP
jgi:hypothetical protein